MKELKQLSPKEKQVAAKVLVTEGYSTRRIAELLDMNDSTAWRKAKEATPEELKQFEADFTLAISQMKKKGLALVQKRLLELIPKERRIEAIVRAGEYLEGKSNVQINNQNISAEMKLEFIEAEKK